MNLDELKNMMIYVSEKMIESEPMLTNLDQVIGDGDHGIGIKRGFAHTLVLLQDVNFSPTNTSDFFVQIGTKLMTSMGGASGAVFGTLFRAGGKGIPTTCEKFTTEILSILLNDGYDAVQKRGGANPGDKTMIDSLFAAKEMAKQLNLEPLKQSLPKIAEAAMEGAERTKQMKAIFGRAKNLGDRSIGHVDPGSVSMALILKYMSQYQ